MTRKEAIRHLEYLKVSYPLADVSEWVDMAIEALSQPIVAKHFDIQSGYIYCSPQIAENVKVVVRCKDCKYLYMDNHCPLRTWHTHVLDDYCSYGERKGGEDE